ncbi:hypothetical protein ABTF44_20920, partial [Acinetobacter baumannii]
VPVVFLALLTIQYFYLRALVTLDFSQRRTELLLEGLSLVRWAVCVYIVFAISLYLGCVLSLLDSFRRVEEPTEKNQVKWIFFGVLLATF